jgi:hypothetical protein
MDFNDNKHLDVCQNIEASLKHEYDFNPKLTDTLCIFALENVKIAVKQQFGYAQNESVSKHSEVQGVIKWCVNIAIERVDKINDLTLKEYLAHIEKIRISVQLHASGGSRSYYEFIRAFFP